MQNRGADPFVFRRPKFSQIVAELKYLCGNNRFLLTLYAVGILISLAILIKNHRTPGFFEKYYLKFFIASVPVSIVLVLYLYGMLIKPEWGILKNRLFTERYYFAFLPFVFITIALTIIGIFDRVKLSTTMKNTCCVALCVFLAGKACVVVPSTELYRPTADNRYDAQWLLSQEDIYEESTIIFLQGGQVAARGFSEYYINRKWNKELPMVMLEEIEKIDLEKYSTIYLYGIWNMQWGLDERI